VVRRGFRERRRVALACSAGGHLSELLRALEGIVLEDAFLVTYPSPRPLPAWIRRVYHLPHPRRRLWPTLCNAVQAFWVMWRERPEIVISTGADVALFAILWGKLFGARVIFIENGGTLRPSLTGRLVYPIADLFVVQWPELRRFYPRAVVAEGLLL